LFNNIGKVAEEYLTNSLDAFETVLHDYPNDNLNRSDCKIQFILDSAKSELFFKDEHPNLGMSSDKIFNSFFKIHGKNKERDRYINVRGKHGTGKSAAFGIKADYLSIDSVKDNKRTTIVSTYESLLKEDSEPARLEEIRVDEETELPNGTTIRIKLPKDHTQNLTSLRSITKCLLHIQRVFTKHLNRYNVEFVTIKRIRTKSEKIKERITYQPRAAVYEKKYPVTKEIAKVIGQTELIIKRAAEPMEETAEKGINITSGGYTKEQTAFGLDNEPYANHFFGEWEIPLLDQYKGTNPPMLSTRELRLNQNNEMVQKIYEFGKNILNEEIKSFAKNEKVRKQDEKIKKLSEMGNELAMILNEDYAEFEEISKLEKGKKGKINRKGEESDAAISTSPEEESNTISPLGEEIRVDSSDNGPLIGSIGGGELPSGAEVKSKNPTSPNSGPLESKFNEIDMEEIKKNAVRRAKRRICTGGGFRIEFIQAGHNVFITRFDESSKIIFINMDSEIIKTHLKNCGSEEQDPSFKTYAYTLAIDEYARAVVNVMSGNHEFSGMSFEEYLLEGVTELGIIKRRILNRLSKIVKED